MNKKALVTGGTKGIGLSVARRLMAEGFDVILTYGTDVDRAEEVLNTLQSSNSTRVSLLHADISDLSAIDVIDQYLSDNHILLDTLVLNAGLTYRASFEDMELSEWKRIFDANVHFPVFLIQKIVQKIRPGSSIVFTGSLMGVHAHSVSLVYGVSKSTVHSLVKNLVKFLAPYRIRVNGVAPGFVDTEWQKYKPAEVRASINTKIAVERFCEPDEMADVYWLLISNEYMNGEIVVADGGYSYK